MNAKILKLCLVTHLQNQSFSLYQPFLLQAIHGGITAVQLRDKNKPKKDIRQLALQLKAMLQPFNLPLIINDHVDIAKEIDADGVHIGQSDISPVKARKMLGPQKIIGWSVESWQDLEEANQLTCIDYIAASAVFCSQNKSNCKTIWGLNGLKNISQLSKYPVIAIGGINESNVGSVIENGACGAAVIDGIHQHEDPRQAATNLIINIDIAMDKRGRHV